jgi:hypothetical protein
VLRSCGGRCKACGVDGVKVDVNDVEVEQVAMSSMLLWRVQRLSRRDTLRVRVISLPGWQCASETWKLSKLDRLSLRVHYSST